MAGSTALGGVWTQRILGVVEPIIFDKRHITHVVLLLITGFLVWQMAQIRPDAGLEKSIPQEHEYMQVRSRWESDFGAGNTVLLAAIQKEGEIYNADFIDQFKKITDEVFFIPGIDRVKVMSITTPNVLYVEVVEGGLAGENIIPGNYDSVKDDPKTFKTIKEAVGKANILGRLVSNDHRGAMVYAELLEDVVNDKDLKNKLQDGDPAKAVLEECDTRRLDGYACVAYQLEKIRENYATDNIDIHIIGFAKVVGDMVDATLMVLVFFAIALVMTIILLWLYCGSFKLALLPMGCSIIAIVWEFGLFRLLGFGLDPFAILVPFLVLSVSVSHGVQYVNAWVDEIAAGKNSYDASLETFRRLAIPGTTALITDVAGFATIYLISIAVIQEMSINAALGIAAIIITNKMLMPIWLTMVTIKKVDKFQVKHAKRDAALDKIWIQLAKITRPVPAAITIFMAALCLVWAFWEYPNLKVGDAIKGVPELKPDSRYNLDNAAIVDNFSVATDILTVIAESHGDACIDHEVMGQVDRFLWHMQNVEGVTGANSLTDFIRQFNSGFNEGRLNTEVVPRNRFGLSQASSLVPTTTGTFNDDCDALAIHLFLADHKSETIARVIQAVKDFNAEARVEDPTAETLVNIAYQAKLWNGAQTKIVEEGTAPLGPDGMPVEEPEEITESRQEMVEEMEINKARYMEKIYELAEGYTPPESVKYPEDEESNRTALNKMLDSVNEFDPELTDLETTQVWIDSIREIAAAAYDPTKAHQLNFAVGTGTAGIWGATNELVKEKEKEVVIYVYIVILVFMWLSFKSLAGIVCVVAPLSVVSVMAYGVMSVLDIGLKVATLPVVALAVGIGVDYGIYIFSTIQEGLNKGLTLEEAFRETLSKTGKAVIFTGISLGASVITWLWSGLQFQIDMGIMLLFMFTANMFGAILVLPALARFFCKLTPEQKQPSHA